MKLSASVMCADLLHLADELEKLKDAGIDELHLDIMDGHFVPNIMLSTELGKRLKNQAIPRDFHLMVENPGPMLPWFLPGEGDVFSLHVESAPDLHGAFDYLHRQGALCALALSPQTPLSAMEPYLPQLDRILMMTVPPGRAGQPMAPGSLERIAAARDYLAAHGKPLPIQVDGHCSPDMIPKMAMAGASNFVLGTSALFRSDRTIAQGAAIVRKALEGIEG